MNQWILAPSPTSYLEVRCSYPDTRVIVFDSSIFEEVSETTMGASQINRQADEA
ncbi:MAG: hypothetical protein AAF671_04945 [Pseudomonadota bacterium]